MKKILAVILALLFLMSNVICVSAEYNNSHKSTNDVSFTPRAIICQEQEPNDDIESAQVIYSDYTVSAEITYSTTSNADDIDIYKIVFPISGTANFWVGNIPSTADIDLLVYDEDFEDLGSSEGEGQQELVTANVVAGTTYYIQVYAFSLSASSDYTLRARVSPNTYAFYSQNTMTGFNTNNLDKLYNNASSTESVYKLIDDAGCVMCSYAMVLNNLSKKTISSEYDFRTGETKSLDADPFTVTMANCNFPNITSQNTNRYLLNVLHDPVELQSNQRVAGHFGVTPKEIWVGSYSAEEKAKILAYYIAQNPEGITAWYQNGAGNHTIVFTNTTYEISDSYVAPTVQIPYSIGNENIINTVISDDDIAYSEYILNNKLMGTTSNNTVYGSQFTVYDPANTAGGILFNQSWTATSKGWDALYRIVFFD